MCTRNKEIIKKYKNRNDRQTAFKEITHRLDIEVFGIKYKKVKATQKRMEH